MPVLRSLHTQHSHQVTVPFHIFDLFHLISAAKINPHLIFPWSLLLPGHLYLRSSRFVFVHFLCFFFFSFLKDVKLKDEECERLSKVRDQLGQELEELTASLFEVGPTG